jgi:hypothetical protein
MGGGKMFIVADDDFVESVTEVAVRITVGFPGTASGPVYVVESPLAVSVGVTVPHPGEHAVPPCVRLQITPAFDAS